MQNADGCAGKRKPREKREKALCPLQKGVGVVAAKEKGLSL